MDIKISIVSLKVVLDKKVSADLPKEVIHNPDILCGFLKTLIGDCDREQMIVICLDKQLHINCVQTVSIGTLNQALIHPREIFKIAVATNAGSIIMAHNHPGQTLVASPDDIMVSKRIKEAGDILGIELMDHLIITMDGYLSFKEEGHI